jgi:hypothetical protein
MVGQRQRASVQNLEATYHRQPWLVIEQLVQSHALFRPVDPGRASRHTSVASSSSPRRRSSRLTKLRMTTAVNDTNSNVSVGFSMVHELTANTDNRVVLAQLD